MSKRAALRHERTSVGGVTAGVGTTTPVTSEAARTGLTSQPAARPAEAEKVPGECGLAHWGQRLTHRNASEIINFHPKGLPLGGNRLWVSLNTLSRDWALSWTRQNGISL